MMILIGLNTAELAGGRSGSRILDRGTAERKEGKKKRGRERERETEREGEQREREGEEKRVAQRADREDNSNRKAAMR